jgi:N-terminal C2 in EEIG1 and EHBP1 proteins
MSKLLGEADFDLAKYANDERAQDDKLPLKNCSLDPNAYIEIYIKAKVLDT